jgi:hypothetical protein
MYDRQTESLWPQLTGQASVGALTGTELVAIPMGTVAWHDFVSADPQALVLSQDIGFERPDGTNPYTGYDDPNGDLLFGLPGDLDTRFPVKERVIGRSDGPASVVVVRRSLVGSSPLEVTMGKRRVVLWHRPGQALALDAETVAGGADIGTVGAFDRLLDGRRRHFEPRGSGLGSVKRGAGGTRSAGPRLDRWMQPSSSPIGTWTRSGSPV